MMILFIPLSPCNPSQVKVLLSPIVGLKEEAEIGNRSRHGSGASSSGERLEPPDIPQTMEQTLNVILLKLAEKRREAKRPEDVDVRSKSKSSGLFWHRKKQIRIKH